MGAPPATPLDHLVAAARGAADAAGAWLAGLRPPLRKATTPATPSFPGAAKAAARVTREDVGRATWTLLHSVAAAYPERPSRAQRRAAAALVDSLAALYPCAECADHFREHVKHRPVDASSGAGLRTWACEVHNDVNDALAKPRHPCAPPALARRWPALECEVDGRVACAVHRM